MNLSKIFSLTKRQKLVFSVLVLSCGVFLSEFFGDVNLVVLGFSLAILTVLLLFLALKDDIKGTFYYPIFILPFLYTFAIVLFYPLIPSRFLSKILLTALYAFGLYSLFLTENIFAVSGVRTITLLRSARIVSFVLTIVVLFFLINILFSLHLPILASPLVIFVIALVLSFQSLWSYSLDTGHLPEVFFSSLFLSIALGELSLVLAIWPINASIYSIFLTGIFYTYSGLSHAWIEKRLFRPVLWEYLWVGFLSILMLIVFSEWGI